MYTVTVSAAGVFAFGIFTGCLASVISLIVIALIAGKKKK